MGEVRSPVKLLVLDEVSENRWTQYQAFVDRLVELGIEFPFDGHERLPQTLPDRLEGFTAITVPASREAQVQSDQRVQSFQANGGMVSSVADAALPFAPDQTEPTALGWVANNALEHWLTCVRPDRSSSALRDRLIARDDASLARQLLQSAHANNRRYMTYGDFPSVYWYCYLACAEAAGKPECVDVVRSQMAELCSDGREERMVGCAEVRWTQMGEIPAWLFVLTGDSKYRDYAREVADAFLEEYPLSRQGYFCHRGDWTCGEIDEACARALSRAAKVLDRPELWDAVGQHFVASYTALGDPASGLPYHAGGGWGHTPVIWGRGVGWSIWGLVQALGSIPDGHPRRPDLLYMLRRYADGLGQTQTSNGLWRNLMLHLESEPESSCTAMFLACLAHSLRYGWLPADKSLCESVDRAWEGLKSRIWQGWLLGCCTGMAMSMNESYYWRRPMVRAMPFLALWAASEYLAWKGVAW